MSLEKLDLLFPFLVFVYGALMTLVLETPFFAEMAENRLPPTVRDQLKAHKGFAFFCFVIGSLWSLQNLWL